MTMGTDRHITVLWVAKGGSGTTVTTAAAAIAEPSNALIVDLQGDMTDVLATPWANPGLDDWLLHDPADSLEELLIEVDATTHLLPTRNPIDLDQVKAERVERLAQWMRATDAVVLVDAGTGPPADALIEIADRNLLVTRACYLGLMKGVRADRQPDGIVLINEPSRSLNSSSVEQSLNAPIVATIDHHPSIARSVDAGLLTWGHHHLNRSTAAITRPDPEPTALDRWRELGKGRHSPDVDYGMHWRATGSDDTWRVSWNRGSRALYATNRDETIVEDLGTFATEHDVAAALPEWGRHHTDPDGLDWVRQQVGKAPAIETPTLSVGEALPPH
ncbi:hypothetical protein [Ilumatobacter sp.]|uniref:hypothetical protein n=1 Tax=Ilumatobacter sp. TaxID=1967498 RepID=UPI003B51C47D